MKRAIILPIFNGIAATAKKQWAMGNQQSAISDSTIGSRKLLPSLELLPVPGTCSQFDVPTWYRCNWLQVQVHCTRYQVHVLYSTSSLQPKAKSKKRKKKDDIFSSRQKAPTDVARFHPASIGSEVLRTICRNPCSCRSADVNTQLDHWPIGNWVQTCKSKLLPIYHQYLSTLLVGRNVLILLVNKMTFSPDNDPIQDVPISQGSTMW